MNIDWGNKIINIEKSDMTLVQTVPSEVYTLDVPTFKRSLGAILDDTVGMSYPDIFKHNPELSIGGVNFAKVIEILAPYTITFVDGQYSVNIVGANTNLSDRVNKNQVSTRSALSAGLISADIQVAASVDQATMEAIATLVWANAKAATKGDVYAAALIS